MRLQRGTVLPGGHAHGASIRTALRGRRGPPGCGSTLPGTCTLGPGQHCSCPEPLWCWSPGTSAHRDPALQGPHAATFPQGGTLYRRPSPHSLVSQGPASTPALLGSPQVPLLPKRSSSAPATRGHPSRSYPPTQTAGRRPGLTRWPSCHPDLCVLAPTSHAVDTACLSVPQM